MVSSHILFSQLQTHLYKTKSFAAEKLLHRVKNLNFARYYKLNALEPNRTIKTLFSTENF